MKALGVLLAFALVAPFTAQGKDRTAMKGTNSKELKETYSLLLLLVWLES